jgi:hypothetical protein
VRASNDTNARPSVASTFVVASEKWVIVPSRSQAVLVAKSWSNVVAMGDPVVPRSSTAIVGTRFTVDSTSTVPRGSLGPRAATPGDDAMTSAEAVHDGADDCDIFDPRYVRDRYPIWEELDGCSVAHTAPSGGSDLPRTCSGPSCR